MSVSISKPLKVAAVSAVLVGGAAMVQGDGVKGAAKSSGIQLVSSGVTHMAADKWLESKAGIKADDWSGLALEAAVVGGLFTAAERWGRGSCCPVKDFLTSSIADFAAGAGVSAWSAMPQEPARATREAEAL